MDTTTRIIVGVLSVGLLVAYFAWRWKRAGDYVAGQEAFRQEARQYFEAMKLDGRWLALKTQIDARYSLSLDFAQTDPSVFVLHHLGLVDDKGFTYRVDSPAGPDRVVAMIVRKQPPEQLFVSMDLQTSEVREDPAPHGWTYTGPPR